jgi:hypothetical protein
VYRKIKKCPHVLYWWQIDSILVEYHQSKGIVTEGLERARSRWDNHFANLDGRNRRLSKADTVKEDEVNTFGGNRGLNDERIFLYARRAWILLNFDAEVRFRQISNIHEIPPLEPEPTSPPENQAQARLITSQGDKKKKKRSNNRRNRSQTNRNPPVGDQGALVN